MGRGVDRDGAVDFDAKEAEQSGAGIGDHAVGAGHVGQRFDVDIAPHIDTSSR